MNEIDFLVAKSIPHLSSLVIDKIFAGDETAWAGDVSDCAFDMNNTYQLLVSALAPVPAQPFSRIVPGLYQDFQTF